jgi:hypothetical protein
MNGGIIGCIGIPIGIGGGGLGGMPYAEPTPGTAGGATAVTPLVLGCLLGPLSLSLSESKIKHQILA